MSADMDEVRLIVRWCGGGLVSLLLAGNIFFVKRLVDKIESEGDTIASQGLVIQSLKDKIDSLEHQIGALRKHGRCKL